MYHLLTESGHVTLAVSNWAVSHGDSGVIRRNRESPRILGRCCLACFLRRQRGQEITTVSACVFRSAGRIDIFQIRVPGIYYYGGSY